MKRRDDLSDIELLDYFVLETNYHEWVVSIYIVEAYSQFKEYEWVEVGKEIYNSGIMAHYELTDKGKEDLANYHTFQEL